MEDLYLKFKGNRLEIEQIISEHNIRAIKRVLIDKTLNDKTALPYFRKFIKNINLLNAILEIENKEKLIIDKEELDRVYKNLQLKPMVKVRAVLFLDNLLKKIVFLNETVDSYNYKLQGRGVTNANNRNNIIDCINTF